MNICYEIASRRYKQKRKDDKANHRSVDDGRLDYWQWQYDSSEIYFAKFHDLYSSMQGKRIMDIGCGLGGRSCYLASRCDCEIVASDINHEEIDLAIKFADEKLDSETRKRIKFEKVSEEGKTLPTLPSHGATATTADHTDQTDIRENITKNKKENFSHLCPSASSAGSPSSLYRDLFDIVLLVDSMEHVRDPSAMLELAYSMTKPGGLCYLSTVGWYNHMASHVGSIVPIHFMTVFFSDKQILDAIRMIVAQSWYVPSVWDTDPPVKRWEGVNDLSERPGEYLNKITVQKLKQVVKMSKFTDVDFNVQGFSSRLPLLKLFNFLSNIPVVQEVYHSGLFVRMKRGS